MNATITLAPAVLRIVMSEFTDTGVLARRDAGRDARARIEALLDEQTDGQAAVLDFGGVDAMTLAFADECVGRLVEKRTSATEHRPLACAHATDDVHDALAAVAALRGLLLILISHDGRPELLGASPALAETARVVIQLGSFRTVDLTALLGLTMPAANMRIKPLLQAGLVTRHLLPAKQVRGKEFAYQTLPFAAIAEHTGGPALIA